MRAEEIGPRHREMTAGEDVEQVSNAMFFTEEEMGERPSEAPEGGGGQSARTEQAAGLRGASEALGKVSGGRTTWPDRTPTRPCR